MKSTSLLLLIVLLLAGGGVGAYVWTRTSDAVVTRDSATVEIYELPEEDREWLWDLEHRSNVLTKIGLTRIINGIVDRQTATVTDVLADDFQGRIPPEKALIEFQSDALRAERREFATGEPGTTQNAEQFSEWLSSYRDHFAEEPQIRFDVMRITPGSRPPDLWHVLCQQRWAGESTGGEQLEITMIHELQVSEPTKQSMQTNGWLRQWEVQQVHMATAATPLFADVTGESGIDVSSMYDSWQESETPTNTGGLYAWDFNRDGWLDLYITDYERFSGKLYEGIGDGRFKDVTAEKGLRDATDSTKVALIDIDNDGWVDLINHETGVFRNVNGNRFVPYRTNLLQLIARWPTPIHHLSGLHPADFDRDGLLDIYVTRSVPALGSWLESTQPNAPSNQLLRNRGGGQFEDVTLYTSTESGGRSCFTANWLDVNADMWPDIYVCNEFGNGLLLVNQQGTGFTPREIAPDAADFGSMGLTSGDFNNDGRVDLYVSNMYSKAGSRIIGNTRNDSYPAEVMDRLRSLIAGSELYRNDGDLQFTAIGTEMQVHNVGWSWGSAMADLNNDGWLDLYTTAGFISRDRRKPDG